MRRTIKITSIAAILGVLAAGALFSVYKASQRVPEFYDAAVAVPEQDQAEACDAFVAQVAALAGDLNQGGYWQSLFTAEQINAWLALELANNYPDMLPSELHDPRVSLRKNEATIGCRFQTGELATVLSLTVDPYLQEPNVVALRIRGAHAGALPVPMAQVLDSISRVAQILNLRIQWRKSHGDPVALVTLPAPRNSKDAKLCIETLEVRDGELFVSGTNDKGKLDASPIVPEPLRVPTAKRTSPETDQPRVGAADKATRQE